MNNELSFLEKVVLFNDIGGTKAEFDKRKASLYVGLCIEELGEMIESLNQTDEAWVSWVDGLDNLATLFKSGKFDYVMDNVNRIEFLDAAVDIAVVATGAGIAIGSDIIGAMGEVATNNLTKYNLVDGKYEVLLDENGKIRKPLNYLPVNLEQFLK